MILYIFATVIFIIIMFFCFIRLKYKFWSIQPVFHFYDIYYWFVNVGIIRNELPEKNRYVNLTNIKTYEFNAINDNIFKQIVVLIKLNYLQNKENIFSPTKDNIIPYFIGHNTSTFLSYYVESEVLIDNKTNKTFNDDKIIGVITGRPLHVYIYNKATFDVYYIDYLCVHKNFRKKNIAPQLIQTHEYRQSHNNKKIAVSMFKREEELTGIIPLTVYHTYCFNMKNWLLPPEDMHSKVILLTGDKQNMYYLYNFINELTKNGKWDITVYPEISNVIELVSTKNLFIKMLIINGEIEALYIFRKTCTYIEKHKEILSCIASVNGNTLTNKEFINGFKVALWSIVKIHHNFKYLTVESISDNKCIIDNLSIKTHPYIVSPMAYFFYNFAYSPFKSEKCLIIQ